MSKIEANTKIDPDELDEIRDYAAEMIADGFNTREEVVASIIETFDWGAFETLDAEKATNLINEWYDAKVADEANWPAVTDVDKLYAAFTALEAEGFVCLHNPDGFPSDAQYAAQVAWEQAGGLRSSKWAAVYYHGQSVGDAIECGEMYLSFMGFPNKYPTEEAAFGAAGMLVVKALNEQGLKTDWNGNPGTNIKLFIDWKKRAISEPIKKAEETLLERDKNLPPPDGDFLFATPETIARILGGNAKDPKRTIN
jgi:hypothetical protein